MTIGGHDITWYDMDLKCLAGGDHKELLFYNAFQKGFLSEIHDKIIYVYLDNFPEGYIEDGWLAEM